MKSSTSKELENQVEYLIKNFGMKSILETISNYLDQLFNEYGESYIKNLKTDIDKTLYNYEKRYDDEQDIDSNS
jgi:hypothetical protein